MSPSTSVSPPPANGTNVVIDNVVHLTTTNTNNDRVSFPSLISFQNKRVPRNTSDVSLTVKKRKRPSQPDSDVDQARPELFAKTADRAWVAEHGFNELNAAYYVGIRSKSTGRMRLVQVDSIYRLRPHASDVGALFDELDAAQAEEDKQEGEDDYMQKRKKVVSAFGSTRAVRRLERFSRNRITEEKVDEKTAEQITKATQKMVDADAAEGIRHNAMSTTESFAPPHDNAAKTPKDAYPIIGLLSPEELSELSEASAVMEDLFVESEGEPLENPGWHPLVWAVLLHILKCDTSKSPLRTTRLQCIMHVHYLLTLMEAPRFISRTVRQKLLANMAVSEETLWHLLQRFTRLQEDMGSKDTFVRTEEDAERIAKHCVIMWMHALGFENCGKLVELSEALGLPLKKLLWYANSLGCKVRKQKDVEGPQAFRVSLKLPLVFPAMRKRAMRMKRTPN